MSPASPWPSDSPAQRGTNFQCRMLVKPSSEQEEDVELKQSYVSQYESMQIAAIFQPCQHSSLSSNGEWVRCFVEKKYITYLLMSLFNHHNI